MGKRQVVTLIVLLAVLLFGAISPANAASTWTPGAGDIEGYYAVVGKFLISSLAEPVAYKGAYGSIFHITAISGNEVELVWLDAEFNVLGTYRAHYMNGVLLIGAGDDTQEPGVQAETLVLEFSGAPGRLKMSGKYLYYTVFYGYVGSDALKGRLVTEPI